MTPADAYDAFLLDLDGVVWRGETPVRGAAEAVTALRERGKRVVFVTNNSSRTPREYAVKLFRMRLPTPTGDIVTSGHVVVSELRRLGLGPGDRVHVCGGEGLSRVIAKERLVPTSETTDVGAVVVGWNPKGSFEDISRAASLAREGVPLLASNADPTYPGADELLPGTGAILAAIETASGARAKVVGKPEPELFRLALDRAGVAASQALVCGDRPSTDVAGGRAAGIATALVLTGVTSERDLWTVSHVPDHILDDLTDLLRELPADPGSVRVESARNGSTVEVSALHVPKGTDRRGSWLVLRRLLVEAVAGSTEVRAGGQVRPYLERIGVPTGAQRKLFD